MRCAPHCKNFAPYDLSAVPKLSLLQEPCAVACIPSGGIVRRKRSSEALRAAMGRPALDICRRSYSNCPPQDHPPPGSSSPGSTRGLRADDSRCSRAPVCGLRTRHVSQGFKFPGGISSAANHRQSFGALPLLALEGWPSSPLFSPGHRFSTGDTGGSSCPAVGPLDLFFAIACA